MPHDKGYARLVASCRARRARMPPMPTTSPPRRSTNPSEYEKPSPHLRAPTTASPVREQDPKSLLIGAEGLLTQILFCIERIDHRRRHLLRRRRRLLTSARRGRGVRRQQHDQQVPFSRRGLGRDQCSSHKGRRAGWFRPQPV